jgi:hypothetical protein
MRRALLLTATGIIFRSGGHGFGMRKQGTSTDHWIDAFYYWLEGHGLTTPKSRPG